MSTETKSALAPVTEGDARRDALLRAIGFDKLNEGQRELALAIAHQYDLDPMLRHVVMVDGKPYITRDGLLHVAHKSGDFDGIEVDPPTLDADGKYWRTICRVYRRSFSRPFIYPGRYPATSGNVKYNEEMAIKVAEVMTLRRAFDVSAPVLEERWDSDYEEEVATPQPTSLAERVAQRALAASASATQPETGAPVSSALADSTPETQAPAPVADDEEDLDGALLVEVVEEAEEEEEDEPVEGVFVAPPQGFVTQTSIPAETLDSDPLDAFKAWAKDHDKDLIRRVARELFPTLTGFKDLNAKELGVIQHEVTKVELAEAEGEPLERCAAPSPLTGNLCTLDPGHPGVHRHGTRESWAS